MQVLFFFYFLEFYLYASFSLAVVKVVVFSGPLLRKRIMCSVMPVEGFSKAIF